MTEIPLPWVVTLLAAMAAIAVARGQRLPASVRVMLGLGLVAFGLVGFVLGLRISYDFAWAGRVQPHLALLACGALYLGMEGFSVEDPYPWARKLLLHAVPLIAAALAIVLSGMSLADVVVPLITIVYAVLFLRLLLRPPETFLHATPNSLPVIRSGLVLIVVLFSGFFIGDVVILASVVLVGPEVLPTLINRTSQSLTVFVMLGAIVAILVFFGRGVPAEATPPEVQDPPEHEDKELLERFDALMRDTRLYTDPDLTLARAARRLGVPARSLSKAVNKAGGTNVSRYINGFRIRHAQDLLQQTDVPVTEIMLEVGFLSKSAFNTEFRRITNKTPSDYRAAKG